MKKTIFKGTINGKQFDTVQAYNEEMMRALAAGESVNAESHTETVDTEDSIDSEIDYLPGLDKNDEYYIDRLTCGDPEKNGQMYNEEIEYLAKSFDEIKNSLKDLSEEELKQYIKDLEEVIECIDSDKVDNDEVHEDLNEELKAIGERQKDIENELKVIVGASRVIDLYKDYYEDVLSMVKSHITPNELLQTPTCGCNCECKCKEPQKESDTVEYDDVNKMVNTLKDMVKSIFG